MYECVCVCVCGGGGGIIMFVESSPYTYYQPYVKGGQPQRRNF
jgi:hypothetical protein